MVNLQTENIRCVLCNKHLDVMAPSIKELTICGECQAYFCPTCLGAIRNYDLCPAASLLGVADHELRFVKLLPPKQTHQTRRVVQQNGTAKTIKIIGKNKVKILDKKDEMDD